jgi:hypothetical protein
MNNERNEELQSLRLQLNRLTVAANRVLNLSRHPLFVPQDDLPAWAEALADLREKVQP